MKKISTLAVALMTLGSLVTPAQADKVPTSTLPSGYYKIKSAAADRTRKNVFNDFSVSGNVNNVTLVGEAEGNTNNYIWHITNDGASATIGIVNGQGTPFTRENGNHGDMGVVSYSTLTPKNVTSLESVLFGEYFHNPGNTDGNHTYGDYMGVAVWQNKDLDNTRWKLENLNIPDEDVYTVSIVTTSTGSKPYITRTLADGTKENAFNSGFFISDANLEKTSLTASTLEGYKTPEINVDNAEKTITAYYAKFDDLTALISSAKELLNTRGIGYPLSTSDAYNQFAEAIRTASGITAESSAKDCAEAYTVLQGAITNYRSTTTGIQLPEDGKVYKMYGLNGTNKYYAKNGDNQNFVVQKIKDGTYRFVSTSGNQKGYTFESNIDLDLKVYRRINFGALNLALGTVSIGLNSNGSTGRFSGNNYVGTIGGVGYSTDIYFEEVTDFVGQAVNFAASTDSKNYATLNLPYASTLPTGVTAYKAGNVVDNDLNIIVYKNAGDVLPANTPVLLTATSDGSKTFAPAPYAAAEETGFQGTLSAKAVTATNTYILSKNGGETVKFFALDETNNTINANKAYLVVSGGAAQALNFNFGNTTGIQNAAVEGVNANAPLFDLSGRRVVKAVKGGIYIQNGKKFVK